MFKCDYELNGECQLYSKKCGVKLHCNLLDKCSSCKYKMLTADEEPCYRCDNLFKRKE